MASYDKYLWPIMVQESRPSSVTEWTIQTTQAMEELGQGQLEEMGSQQNNQQSPYFSNHSSNDIMAIH